MRGAFNAIRSRRDNSQVEGVLVSYTGPHLAMDLDFYFCKLRLDDGQEVSASISEWDQSLKVGQRVRGRTNATGVFSGNVHLNVLERAPAHSAFLLRVKGLIGWKPGR